MSVSLVNSNNKDFKRKYTTDKLFYPFMLVKQGSDSEMLIKQDELNMRLCIMSSKELDIINEEQILKVLLKKEYNIFLLIKVWIN